MGIKSNAVDIEDWFECLIGVCEDGGENLGSGGRDDDDMGEAG